MTNASGAALSINTYDECGVPGSSNAGRFQYTGQMWIPEAGLYHYKARAYAPGLGRFLQTDPILYAGGMNLYAYVGGDPVNWVDPEEFDPMECPTWPQECGPPIPVLGPTTIGNFASVNIVPIRWPHSEGGGGRGGEGGSGEEEEEAAEEGEGAVDEEIDWQCVAERADAGGFTGAFVGGAAAVAAGAPLIPYNRVPGYERFGIGGRNTPSGGRTSVISAAARSFISGSAGRRIFGTGSIGGAIGRGLSRASVVVGIGLEAYALAQVLDAIEECSE